MPTYGFPTTWHWNDNTLATAVGVIAAHGHDHAAAHALAAFSTARLDALTAHPTLTDLIPELASEDLTVWAQDWNDSYDRDLYDAHDTYDAESGGDVEYHYTDDGVLTGVTLAGQPLAGDEFTALTALTDRLAVVNSPEVRTAYRWATVALALPALIVTSDAEALAALADTGPLEAQALATYRARRCAAVFHPAITADHLADLSTDADPNIVQSVITHPLTREEDRARAYFLSTTLTAHAYVQQRTDFSAAIF